ncbi:unnamed protein product [Blumeria hordei]|uniref:Fungal-type protein kinase domain-containing protein n=1 Tax=Blumeria hordei TaxID=2867405 RepID=A0A383UMJ4_BLUHO|nr:unnamed protein product [Blumeria hordei]
MSLNKEIAEHFAENPLDRILGTFRVLYSFYFTTPCERVFDNPKNVNNCRYLLEHLIISFNFYVQHRIGSPYYRRELLSRLDMIDSWMGSTPFDVAPFEPIANLILNHPTDLEVWNSFMQLVDELESIMLVAEDKPEEQASKSIYRRFVASHDGALMCKENQKQDMGGELEGLVFVNVIGSWDKYFESKRINVERDGLTNKFIELSAEPRYKFPAIPTEDAVWKWMQVIEHDLLKAYRSSTDSLAKDSTSTTEERFGLASTGAQFHTLSTGQTIENQSKRQVDYFIKSRNLPIEDQHHWRDILVVGEITVSSLKVSRQKFLQLSIYMREVFMAQPLRRFVHGFILFERELQIWVCDRSGLYSCSHIDIGKSPEKLVHVLVTYMLMNDNELGLDANSQCEGEGEGENMKAHLQVPGSKELRKFTLDPNPISQQKQFIRKGTSCYRDRTLRCVVKFSWRICDGVSKIGLLEMADNITGKAQVLGSLDLIKTSQLREGLLFTKTMVNDTRPAEKVMNTPDDLSGEITKIPKESVSDQLSRKRKRETIQAEIEMAGSSKKARSMQKTTTTAQQDTEMNSLVSSVRFNGAEAPTVPTIGRKIIAEGSARSENFDIDEKKKTVDNVEVDDRTNRTLLSTNAGLIATNNSTEPITLPGTASSTPKSSADVKSNISQAVKETVPKSVKTENTEVVIPPNCQLTAVGISPYGRPIDKSISALELIIGMRDAIKLHRSLVVDAKILHCNISVNNILLTGIEKNDKLSGILIGLDLATSIKIGKFQEKDRVMRGTKQFIALDILENSYDMTSPVVTHTYRHDLESFLYVLVWICVKCGWKKGTNPHGDFLLKWYTGTVREIHRNKFDYIKRDSLDVILSEFSPMFGNVKGLFEKFRDLLFFSKIKIQTGRPDDPNKLYDPIIAAFDRAIDSLKV